MSIHLYVQIAGQPSFLMGTNQDARIATVKTKISHRTGIPASRMCLICPRVGTSIELRNSHRLSYYGIGHLDTILVLSLDF